MDTQTPRLLAGRYEIGEMLGLGGMGTVHAGRDTVLQRPVAIKLLSTELAGDPEAVERFRREARAAAALSHPNIVQIFDTGSDGDFDFIVMELIEGRTLARLIEEEGPLEAERATRIAREIALGLAAAHEIGLVHRDVKPGNVMLTEDGRVKVMDFGIVRAAGDDSRTKGTVFGTAAYVSPEQARGRPVTPASDVYALGCVLYQMLTVRLPFTAATPIQVAVKHVRERPVPPSHRVETIPRALEDAVLRAMEKDPARRPADAAAFAAALDGVRADQPFAQLEGAEAEQPLAPLRRRLPLSVAAALAAAVALALVPGLFGGGRSNRAVTAEAGRVRVPSVVGLAESHAMAMLRERGLIPRLLDVPLDDGVEGTVAEQRPPAGTLVQEGTLVSLRLANPGPGSATTDDTEKDEDADRKGNPSKKKDREKEEGASPEPTQQPSPASPAPSPIAPSSPDPSPSPPSSPSPSPSPSPTPSASPTP